MTTITFEVHHICGNILRNLVGCDLKKGLDPKALWKSFTVAGLALFLLFAATASAQAEGTQARVLESKKLMVCIWPEYYGITYRNPKTLELSGIDIDLAQEFAHDLGTGVTPVFVDSSFSKLVADVTEDRCDVAMFAIGITAARAERLHFTEPTLRSDIYAIASKTNRRILKWDDIDRPGVVVAVAKGTYHEPVMRSKLKAATLLVADTPFAREQEVESGRADLFMTDYPYSQRMLAMTDWARLLSSPVPYHLTSYAYAVKPGDEEWHARVERFVRDIKRDGRLLTAAKRHKLEAIVIPE